MPRIEKEPGPIRRERLRPEQPISRGAPVSGKGGTGSPARKPPAQEQDKAATPSPADPATPQGQRLQSGLLGWFGGPPEKRKLENQGGLRELTPPEGFERKEHQDGVLSSFSPKAAPEARLRYERREGYQPDAESMKAYRELMTPGPGNPPHELSSEELDRVVQAIPNAPFGDHSNFGSLALRTEDVGGQRVLSMRADYADVDKRAYGVFANPDPKRESIDALWFEAPRKAYDRYEKEALRAIHSVQWQPRPSKD